MLFTTLYLPTSVSGYKDMSQTNRIKNDNYHLLTFHYIINEKNKPFLYIAAFSKKPNFILSKKMYAPRTFRAVCGSLNLITTLQYTPCQYVSALNNQILSAKGLLTIVCYLLPIFKNTQPGLTLQHHLQVTVVY